MGNCGLKEAEKAIGKFMGGKPGGGGGGGGGQTEQAQGPPPPTHPAGPTGGRCKALLIGINYYGQKGQLRGCVNDVKVMCDVLDAVGFSRQPGYENAILVDDRAWPGARPPTRRNIMEAIRWLVSGARPGDTLIFHFSGHGGQVRDVDGDEEDGYDETLIPVDYKQAGQITDDELHQMLVAPLPQGCRLTAVMDCCHSGSVLDLPYAFVASRNVMQHIMSNPTDLAKAVLLPKQRNAYIMDLAKGLMKGNFTLKGSNTRGFKSVSKKKVAADVIMFSGCEDKQTSADVADVGKFGLPGNAGPGGAGGACTNALAKILLTTPSLPLVNLLEAMRQDLEQKRFSQVPQLSASRPVDLRLMFSVYGSITPVQQSPQYQQQGPPHPQYQQDHGHYQADPYSDQHQSRGHHSHRRVRGGYTDYDDHGHGEYRGGHHSSRRY